MGPRSGDRGNAAQIAMANANAQLQWGRGQVTAEMAGMVEAVSGPDSLQWGRGQVTAEMNPHGEHTIADLRFNGAAVR